MTRDEFLMTLVLLTIVLAFATVLVVLFREFRYFMVVGAEALQNHGERCFL